MKKLSIVIASLLVMTLSVNVMADGGKTAKATANATAKIITPIAITADGNGLQFGSIASGTSTGTVTIAATSLGERTSTGDVTPSTVESFKHGSAEYAVAGEINATYTITLPESVTISADDKTMTVNQFTSSHSNNIGTLSADGTETIYVGATLNVGAGQATGNYTGSYDVTVAYN